MIDKLFGKSGEDVLEDAGSGTYSDDTAADMLAQAASQSYAQGNLTEDELDQYLEKASQVAQEETALENFEGLDELGNIDDISPDSTQRDRMREGLRTTQGDLTEYDVVVSAGGSSYSFADEIADMTGTQDVAVTVNSENPDNQNEVLENSYVFAEDSEVEVLGPQVENREVLFVTDRGTHSSDKGSMSQAVIDASSSYEHVEVDNLGEGLNL